MNSYIKDSANNYTLYIDQGTDVSFDIPASSFTTGSINTLEFFGTIKPSSASTITSIAFTITKTLTAPQKITLILDADDTIMLSKDKYGFDVVYIDANFKTTRAFGGSVIVTHNYSSTI